jgi:hypothetical protein
MDKPHQHLFSWDAHMVKGLHRNWVVLNGLEKFHYDQSKYQLTWLTIKKRKAIDEKYIVAKFLAFSYKQTHSS